HTWRSLRPGSKTANSSTAAPARETVHDSWIRKRRRHDLFGPTELRCRARAAGRATLWRRCRVRTHEAVLRVGERIAIPANGESRLRLQRPGLQPWHPHDGYTDATRIQRNLSLPRPPRIHSVSGRRRRHTPVQRDIHLHPTGRGRRPPRHALWL